MTCKKRKTIMVKLPKKYDEFHPNLFRALENLAKNEVIDLIKKLNPTVRFEEVKNDIEKEKYVLTVEK